MASVTFQEGVSPTSDYAGTFNRELYSVAPNTVQGPSVTEEITWYATADQRQAVIKWDLSSIPSDAIITGVTITLYKTGASSTYVVYCRRLLQNWVDAQVTWNSWSTGNLWATAGCKGATDRSATISAQTTATTGAGTISWTDPQLVTDVQNFVSGAQSNYGWTFQREDGFSAIYLTYATKTNATTANRPKIVITYTANKNRILQTN